MSFRHHLSCSLSFSIAAAVSMMGAGLVFDTRPVRGQFNPPPPPPVAPPPLSAKPPASPLKQFPTMSVVQNVIDSHLAEEKGRKPTDLITQSHATAIFKKLEAINWKVSEQQAILANMLPDSHLLPHLFRSETGRKFMQKVGSEDTIYDRLDRISQQNGGKELLQAIIKLPDADKYAKKKPAQGVPNLVDFLPKDASGQTRKIKNYDYPTGRIYTRDQLVRRLEQSHQRDRIEFEKVERQRLEKERPNYGSGISPLSTLPPSK